MRSRCIAFLALLMTLLSPSPPFIVLPFALTGLPEPTVALDRAIAATLGGTIALLAHALRRRIRGTSCRD